MTDLFEEKARDWDANEMVAALAAGIGRTILEHVDLHEAMHVMDFGAGTGLIASQVAPHVRRITAVDVSRSMLEQLLAKQTLADKVEVRCQDIIEEPLGMQFDLIMSAMAMHHVEDTGRMLRAFAEHLKPGAHLALADLDKEDGSFHPEDAQGVFHAGFDRDELAEKLERSGLKEIRFVTAHTVRKEEKDYPVFLVLATKA
ncbi:MAG: class I SAM-dependent DNA methyltransferase [Pseudomonadota bacterium]